MKNENGKGKGEDNMMTEKEHENTPVFSLMEKWKEWKAIIEDGAPEVPDSVVLANATKAILEAATATSAQEERDAYMKRGYQLIRTCIADRDELATLADAIAKGEDSVTLWACRHLGEADSFDCQFIVAQKVINVQMNMLADGIMDAYVVTRWLKVDSATVLRFTTAPDWPEARA